MAKEYNISRPVGSCRECERAFEPEEEFIAAVREVEDELRREDYCRPCWQQKDDPEAAEDLLGTWRTRMPRPQEKKKLFVDDDVLINFFERLAQADDEAKLSFRYVLALVLMRKKILIYEGSRKRDDGRDVWIMRMKGTKQEHDVVDPGMDEDQISQVSDQLGQILEGEL